MPVILEAPASLSTHAPGIQTVPLRFVEAWCEALIGFFACVVVPVAAWAPVLPFADGTGVAEFTIIATAIAFVTVWYCSRRLDSFPGGSLLGHASSLAPVVAIVFAAIAVVLLGLRLEYSRVQLFGSGFLTFLWLLAAASFRARYRVHTYAVMPAGSMAAMPPVRVCRWISFEDALQNSVAVDAIVADLGAGLSESELSDLAKAAISGAPIFDYRFIVESLTGRTPLSGFTPNEFGALLPSRQYLLFRRAVEILITTCLLPLLLPVLASVAVAIRLETPGPVLFAQSRIGRQGRVFRMFKFRTMRHGVPGPSFTAAGDRRITRVGAVLRRYRLDELPQLWNILLGEMNWVGPRPEAVTLGIQYARDIPYFQLRGIVRPGITGWAQVSQGYAQTSDEMRTKLEYDLYYLKHCSLWLDLVIILRTIAVIVGGSGAR